MWKNIEKRLIYNRLRFVFFPFPLLVSLLYFHVARHTFGTTVTLANNVPLQDVSVMLGHAYTRMTQHYARVMNSSLKEAMNNVKERLAQ